MTSPGPRRLAKRREGARGAGHSEGKLCARAAAPPAAPHEDLITTEHAHHRAPRRPGVSSPSRLSHGTTHAHARAHPHIHILSEIVHSYMPTHKPEHRAEAHSDSWLRRDTLIPLTMRCVTNGSVPWRSGFSDGLHRASVDEHQPRGSRGSVEHSEEKHAVVLCVLARGCRTASPPRHKGRLRREAPLTVPVATRARAHVLPNDGHA